MRSAPDRLRCSLMPATLFHVPTSIEVVRAASSPDNVAMATFESGGLTLAFDDIGGAGEGRPIVLVHGFTSNRKENWQRLGWYGAFERRRIRMIAFDCRGHGESAKPHDPAFYGRENMADDIL